MPVASPTVRRWELAARLRALRLARGLSIEEVAARLMCSSAKISRLETGARGVQPRDIRDLCDLFGVDDVERATLMGLGREAKQRGWWQNHEISPVYSTYIGLEVEASALFNYETIRVPGLLQTADYARSVFAMVEGASAESIEQAVDVRLKRQEILSRADGPRFSAVLDEAALLRQVGGEAVMRAQTAFLLERLELPNVSLRIIPFSAGAHYGMEGTFMLMEFSSRAVSDVVYTEGLSGELFLERDSDLERYRQAFLRLVGWSEDPEVTRRRLQQLSLAPSTSTAHARARGSR